jgi:acetolactate synthase-1/3 small subunit
MATPGHHTLSVLVENRPGVLSRVSGLFSRRGFNIDSLAVGPTERADRSVITIRVDCTRHSVEQVVKQLDKLIDVIRVLEVHPDMAIERELLLIKVQADATHRLEIMRMAEVFNARVVDAGADSLLLECVEHPDRLAALEEGLGGAEGEVLDGDKRATGDGVEVVAERPVAAREGLVDRAVVGEAHGLLQ